MSKTPGIASKNPYRPGAGVSPPVLAGRSRELRTFMRTLGAAPELPANVLITGLRGLGKTVLLKAFEQEAKTAGGWVTSRIQLEPRHNREQELADLVTGLAEKAVLSVSRTAQLRATLTGALATVRESVRVGWNDIEVSLDPSSDQRQVDVVKALHAAAVAAETHGHSGYLLMLDEAQVLRDEADRHGEHPLSLLISAVNSLQDHEIPCGLVLCGLPSLRTNLIKARTYTERMFRGERIGPLGGDDPRNAFLEPLEGTGMSATPELVDRVVAEVEGYPYFVQIWGSELWDSAVEAGVQTLTVELLAAIEDRIYERLDTDFYDGRVESLTPAEQDLLVLTGECPYPPIKTSDLHDRSEKSAGNINVLMGRLVEQGVVYRLQKGQYEYTAPKFHPYLQRRRARLAPDD